MRKHSLLVGVVWFLVSGCVTESRLDESSGVVEPNRIILFAKSVPGVLINDGLTSHYYHWTLEKDGKSHGSILNTDYCTTFTSLELPSTAHDEFLAALEHTRFFQMKSAQTGPEIVDGASKSIEVHYQGRRHIVTQTGAADIDPGFNRMWMLIRNLQDRSTIVGPKEATPEHR